MVEVKLKTVVLLLLVVLRELLCIHTACRRSIYPTKTKNRLLLPFTMFSLTCIPYT